MGFKERLRALPSVDRVIGELQRSAPAKVVADAARAAIDEARARVRSGQEAPSLEDVVSAARARLQVHELSLLRPVINATGVLIHTNLGRVPLGKAQLDAVGNIAGSYSNLEYDLVAGMRGSRHQHSSRLLCTLTGAEAALVVNNNAAAVLITLAALCEGGEVVISRGELIEIGGEFRIPDVMQSSGAILVEVGTTNRTHLGDYEGGITPQTAAIMKVHPSNYRVVGFTAEVSARDLGGLARDRKVMFLHDLGSGFIDAPQDVEWARVEPPVDLALGDGADIVTFSGDKLLGGPQCGIVLGRKDLIEKISHHPLLRAVRPGKMTLAALEATLNAYLSGRAGELPLWAMALVPASELEVRAGAVAAVLEQRVDKLKAEPMPSGAVTGGGSMPGTEVSSWAVVVTHSEKSPDEIEAALRAGETPVIARIEDDRVLLDMRTVAPGDLEALADLVVRALS